MERNIKELIRIVIGKNETGFVLYSKRFEILRFTPKGCWILIHGNKNLAPIWNEEKWVSLESRKRFAYPTIEEARINFEKRKKWELIHCQAKLEVLTQRIERIKLCHKMAKNKHIEILEIPKGKYIQTYT